MNKTANTVVICGNGINAHSIVQTVRRLNPNGRILLLRQSSESKGLAEVLNPDIEHWVVDLVRLNELPEMIEERFSENDGATVLFTDERYHQAFLDWLKCRPESNLRFFIGSSENLQEILDRYLFYRFIEDRSLASVPHTIPGDSDPVAAFGNGFIIRPRLSWFGLKQRERVTLVRNQTEFRTAISAYSSRGLGLDDLSFQEQLSIRNQDNVSVCGWYSETRRHLFCTRKVLQWPPDTGGGDLVERIPDNDRLIAQAVAILGSMKYEGPFEIEFVFDQKAMEFKVTELNPRFWLQHGLIDTITGSALVANYLDMDHPSSAVDENREIRFWVNPLYMLYRALKLDFQSLRVYLSDESWSPLTLGNTIRYILFLAGRKIAGSHG